MPGPLSLIVLAAGLGTRFGGLKQLAAVGPRGEAILDYSAADAVAAGFERIVIVVRSEIDAAIAEHTAAWPAVVATSFVCQDLDPLATAAAAAGRTKPLGTAHAVAVAVGAGGVEGPFAVINADDLYGAEPYRVLARHLLDPSPSGGALVAFEVAKTIHHAEVVTRALCEVDAAGDLAGIEEGTVSGPAAHRVWEGRSGRRVDLRGDEPVSMNFWGFPPAAAAAMDEASRAFAASDRVVSADEVLLPDVVRGLVRSGGPPIAVLRTAGRCLGITHPADLEEIRRQITAPAW